VAAGIPVIVAPDSKQARFRRARLSQVAYQVPAGDTAAGDRRLYRTLSLVNLAIWTMVLEFGDWRRNPIAKSSPACAYPWL
jgi:hypothetical protein